MHLIKKINFIILINIYINVMVLFFFMGIAQAETFRVASENEVKAVLQGEWSGDFINSSGDQFPMTFKTKVVGNEIYGNAYIPDSSFNTMPSLSGTVNINKVVISTQSGFEYELEMTTNETGLYRLSGYVTGPNYGEAVLERRGKVFNASSSKTQTPKILIAAPGTKMVWGELGTDNTSNVVVGQSKGQGISWTSNGKERAAMFRFCWACNPRFYEIDTKITDQFVATTIGSTISYERMKNGNSWMDTVTVLEKKNITIPAGSFDVYVIEIKSKSMSTFWTGRQLVYFSPDIKWNIKVESTDSENNNWTWQVLSVE